MRLTRYGRRFGGEGTIVTLADGCACTAAHCVAAVDGRQRAWIGAGRTAWRVERRWSPAGRDLALLVASVPPRRGRPVTWPSGRIVRAGLHVTIAAWTGRRFVRRAAIVRATTRDGFIADVCGRVGVRPGDSGGAVLAGTTLVGVVTHRIEAPSTTAVRVARVDTPDVGRVLQRLRARAR